MRCDICCALHIIFEGPRIFDAKDYQKYTTQWFLSQLQRIDVRATVTHAEHTERCRAINVFDQLRVWILCLHGASILLTHNGVCGGVYAQPQVMQPRSALSN